MWAKNKHPPGFTIVAYNGIQNQAIDSRMRNGASQVEKAIRMWHTQVGEQPRGGWGSTVAVTNSNCSNGTGGWLGTGLYTCAFEDALYAEGLLPSHFVRKLPVNTHYSPTSTDGRYSMMLYQCSSSNNFGLYWFLKSPTAEDAASLATVEAAGCSTAPRTTYGMRAAKLLNLP